MARGSGPNTGKTNSSTTLLAPVKGWYVGDNISNSPPGTAYVLDNAFPQLDYVRVRRGSQAYATGMTGTISTLLSYRSGATEKLFAATATSIYDVSAGGAIGAATVTGLGSGSWYQTLFTTTGGTFLVACNGVDAVKTYDGAAWANAAITVATPSTLIFPWQFKSRLFFIQKNTLDVWYLPVDSIGGAATKFPMGGIFPRGGYLVAGISWAISANSGLYETCCFITDQGEVAFYDGDGPGATNWALKGVYRLPKPLGRNCLIKTGGDVAVLTEDGIIPLSKVQELDQVALANVAVSKPIAPYYRKLVTDRTGASLVLTGQWSATIWPLESMALFTVPSLSVNDKQVLVANARTGAWARYTGWDSQCFALYNNQLYFGTQDGRVMQAEAGGQDDGGAYTAVCQWSYSDLGAKGRRKQVKMLRPLVQSNFASDPAYQVLTDYVGTINPAPTAAVVSSTAARWGIDRWGIGIWAGAVATSAKWKAATGLGMALSPVLQISLQAAITPDIRITQMDLIFDVGEIMG